MTRPYRQGKLRSYHDMKFIPELRKAYAGIANEVLARDGVTDAAGAPVRYDHRSYKDMGLDVVPMASVNRIVADKLKDGTATVLDGDYTRKMVAAELQRAARDRDRKVLELLALDRALGEVAKDPAKAAKVNPRLPRAMRVSPLARVSKPVVEAASRRLMEARHAALRLDVMERATSASLERIVEATEPKAVAAAAKSRDPAVRAQAPDPATAALLHEAAREELAETRAEAAKTRRSLGYKVGWAMEAWRTAVAPALPETSPVLKAKMRSTARERRDGPAQAQAQAARVAAETVRTKEPEQSGLGRYARPGPSVARETARPETVTGARASVGAAAERIPDFKAGGGAGRDEAVGRAGGGPGGTSADGKGSGAGARDPTADGPKVTDVMAGAARTMSVRLLESTADGLARGVKPSGGNAGPKRAPAVAEALMASMAVGGFLKSIMKLGLTVDQRLDFLQTWTSRPIRGANPVDVTKGRTEETPASRTVAPKADAERSHATSGPARSTVEDAIGTSSQVPATSEVGGERGSSGDAKMRDVDRGPATVGQTKAPGGKGSAGPARGMVVDEPVEMGIPGGEASPASKAMGEAGTRDVDGPTERPGPRTGEDGVVAGGGKRARRVLTPEEIEEEERHRKQRRAVLAKRNKRARER